MGGCEWVVGGCKWVVGGCKWVVGGHGAQAGLPLVDALGQVTKLLVVTQFHNLQQQPCFLVAIP